MDTQKFYVGPRGVDHVVIDDMKTYSGAEVVVVHYDGGFHELMSKKTYELISSTEPGNFTAIRNKKIAAILKEMYPILVEYLSSINGTVDEVKQARTSFLQKSISMITEYDIKVNEMDALINPINAEIQGLVNSLGSELDNIFHRASNYLWTKDDTEFVPGANMMMERTLLEATKVNQTIPKVEPKVDEPKEPAAS